MNRISDDNFFLVHWNGERMAKAISVTMANHRDREVAATLKCAYRHHNKLAPVSFNYHTFGLGRTQSSPPISSKQWIKSIRQNLSVEKNSMTMVTSFTITLINCKDRTIAIHKWSAINGTARKSTRVISTETMRGSAKRIQWGKTQQRCDTAPTQRSQDK